MSGPSETVLRAALQRIHRAATGQSDAAYMSIPANPKEDADLILSAAIDELVELRRRVEERRLWVVQLEAKASGEWLTVMIMDGAPMLFETEKAARAYAAFLSCPSRVVHQRSTSKEEEHGGTTG